jgi:hypothetical protein
MLPTRGGAIGLLLFGAVFAVLSFLVTATSASAILGGVAAGLIAAGTIGLMINKRGTRDRS